jgi:hypothetical protein
MPQCWSGDQGSATCTARPLGDLLALFGPAGPSGEPPRGMSSAWECSEHWCTSRCVQHSSARTWQRLVLAPDCFNDAYLQASPVVMCHGPISECRSNTCK